MDLACFDAIHRNELCLYICSLLYPNDYMNVKRVKKDIMSEKVLVIVPHPDDELNIIGTQILSLNDCYEVSIVFVTNGDFYPEKTNKRIRESNDVAKMMGIKNVYYLGYGDKFKETHIYYTKDSNDVVESSAGMTSTYGIGCAVDFSMLYTGKHSPYNLRYLKIDLKACIEMIEPNIIICNDYDNHVDHKMVSIMVDEIVGELIKENIGYYPLLLKKYAYAGVWEGISDYFIRPMVETKLIDTTVSSDNSICLYEDFQKITILTKELYYPLCYWKSPMYHYLKKYKSQKALIKFPQIINYDDIYYYRPTHNIALRAKVRTSSGNEAYLNDFKIIDTEDIRAFEFEKSVDCCTWIPDNNDDKRTIEFYFDKDEIMNSIVLYQSLDLSSVIKKIHINSDSGFEIDYELSEKKVERIYFEKPLKTAYLAIQVMEYEGKKAGFREIEIINEDAPKEEIVLMDRKPNFDKDVRVRANLFFQSLFRAEMFIRFRIIPAVNKRIPINVKYSIDDLGRFTSCIKEAVFPVIGKGITQKERGTRVIITLTSYPKRFDTLHFTIKSIMHQSYKPDKIILYLGDDSRGYTLPREVQALVSKGLEIKYVEGNIGSYKKFYYAFKEYSNDIIITIDDDLIYETKMVELLMDSYHRFPKAISAKRVHRLRKSYNGILLGYNNWDYEYEGEEKPSHELIATTGGGTLFPPNIFSNYDYDIKKIYELAPHSDDIWIKFLAILNDVKVVFVKGKWIMPKETVIDRMDSLRNINCLDGGNDKSISNLQEYYNINLAQYACWHE